MRKRPAPLLSRRDAIYRSFGALAAATIPVRWSHAAVPADIRIGYQKSSILAVVRQQALFERRFAGARIQWVEFPFGPPLLEAMNADRIDYGYTGNAPPIFAQAARANFVYAAALPGHGDNVAILVRDDAPLRAIADLKGRKVAVGKGSSGHAFLVAALEGAGLDYRAVQPIYLAPADAAAAFARGSVDAWSIWDPYLAIAETARPVRALPVKGGIGRQDAFFLANKTFAEAHADIVKGLNEDVSAAVRWARTNRAEATRLFAQATGVDPSAEARAVERMASVMSPMTDDVIRGQQAVADRFHKIGLLPAPVKIEQLVWR